ncbi:MAG TPA: FAD-dependent monooxygenase [Vicinamibacterales bacterium]
MSPDADVIVAGAGPAGSVAAAALAARGLRVILCDRAAFPRDKVCGDALIADSLAVLDRLGLGQRVAARAATAPALDVMSPSGVTASIPGTLRVLPRRELDAMLVDHAVGAGAEFLRLTIDAPIADGDRIAGVSARDASGAVRELRAPLTVLATGANAAVLGAFDPRARSEASGTALRVYARPRNPSAHGPGSPCAIAVDRSLRPGYAWAFPAPDGLFNVGVGLFRGADLRARGVNLRASLEALLAGHGPIGRRFGPFTDASPIAGAPLRTGLRGTAVTRRGLVVLGEAAGTTYAATGEGIGKAMESALLLDELAAASADLPALGLAFPGALRATFGPRFRAYDVAERWVSYPWFVDYVARRATESPYITRRLSEFLSETQPPSRVFSLRGLWRLTTAR